MNIPGDSISHAHELLVSQLFDRFKEQISLKILVGADKMTRAIRSAEITRPGLAFSGFFDTFSYDRLQLVGNTETGYLKTLSKKTRHERMQSVLSYEVPCFLITNNNEVPADFLSACENVGIPVMQTPQPSTLTVGRLIPFLEEHFADTTCVHGELISVYGVGVLIIGDSGVGKSECALDLVERGHRLIADDGVVVTTPRPNELYGKNNDNIGYNMEIRGLGILNVKDFFGMASIGERAKIDIVVHLEVWHDNKIYDRTGLENKTEEILGVHLPLYEIPVKPGRNVPMLVEMACLTQRMKDQGMHPAHLMQKQIAEAMQKSCR